MKNAIKLPTKHSRYGFFLFDANGAPHPADERLPLNGILYFDNCLLTKLSTSVLKCHTAFTSTPPFKSPVDELDLPHLHAAIDASPVKLHTLNKASLIDNCINANSLPTEISPLAQDICHFGVSIDVKFAQIEACKTSPNDTSANFLDRCISDDIDLEKIQQSMNKLAMKMIYSIIYWKEGSKSKPIFKSLTSYTVVGNASPQYLVDEFIKLDGAKYMEINYACSLKIIHLILSKKLVYKNQPEKILQEYLSWIEENFGAKLLLELILALTVLGKIKDHKVMKDQAVEGGNLAYVRNATWDLIQYRLYQTYSHLDPASNTRPHLFATGDQGLADLVTRYHTASQSLDRQSFSSALNGLTFGQQDAKRKKIEDAIAKYASTQSSGKDIDLEKVKFMNKQMEKDILSLTELG